ncbi:MAG: hypothetical protein WC378_16775 [Opitutaceae bacterium]|jgi:hypothetical protein
MKVTKIKYTRDQGYPEMHCRIDGKPAVISILQIKVALLEYEGVVFLGPEWEKCLDPISIPEDKKTGRNAMTLRGFTRDPEVVNAAKAFLKNISDDNEANLT